MEPTAAHAASSFNPGDAEDAAPAPAPATSAPPAALEPTAAHAAASFNPEDAEVDSDDDDDMGCFVELDSDECEYIASSRPRHHRRCKEEPVERYADKQEQPNRRRKASPPPKNSRSGPAVTPPASGDEGGGHQGDESEDGGDHHEVLWIDAVHLNGSADVAWADGTVSKRLPALHVGHLDLYQACLDRQSDKLDTAYPAPEGNN